jgi:putative hydrolase of the HAD superfamily
VVDHADSASTLRAVTFDFWNTVMWEEPGSLKARRLELWAAALEESGRAVDPVVLERAHDSVHETYERQWAAGRQFKAEDAVALILDRLGGDLPADFGETLLEGFSSAGLAADVSPCDGIEVCLERLRGRGIRLGIVCDIGLTPSPAVRELLQRHELLDMFDDTTFSDEVGHYKPSPHIFRRALGALGNVSAEAAAHVGDRRRTDVAGALAMGMTAIRYNKVFEDHGNGPEAHIVTDDLARLPDLLSALQ